MVEGILTCFLRNTIDFSGNIDKAKELIIIIQFEVFFFDNWCKAHEMLNIKNDFGRICNEIFAVEYKNLWLFEAIF